MTFIGKFLYICIGLSLMPKKRGVSKNIEIMEKNELFKNSTKTLNDIVKDNWSDAFLIEFIIEGDDFSWYSTPVKHDSGLIQVRCNNSSALIFLNPNTDGYKKVLERKIIITDNGMKLCWV